MPSCACQRCGAPTGPFAPLCPECQRELARLAGGSRAAPAAPPAGGQASRPPQGAPRPRTSRPPRSRAKRAPQPRPKSRTPRPRRAAPLKPTGRNLQIVTKFQYIQPGLSGGKTGAENTHALLRYLQYREGRDAEPHVKLDCDPRDRWLDGGLGGYLPDIEARLAYLAEGNPRAYCHTLVVSPDPSQFNQMRAQFPDFQLRFAAAIDQTMTQWRDARELNLEYAAVFHHPIRDYGLQTHAHILIGASHDDGAGHLEPVYHYQHDVAQFKEILQTEMTRAFDPDRKYAIPHGLAPPLHRALRAPLTPPPLPTPPARQEPPLSVKEAAELLHLPPRTVRGLLQKELLTGAQSETGRKEWHIDRASVVRYALEQLPNSPSTVSKTTAPPPPTAAPLSVREAAQLLGLPNRTVRGLIHKQELAGVKPGHAYQISRASLAAYAVETLGWKESPFAPSPPPTLTRAPARARDLDINL